MKETLEMLKEMLRERQGHIEFYEGCMQTTNTALQLTIHRPKANALASAIAVIEAASELKQHCFAPLDYGHCTVVPVEKAYLDALIAAVNGGEV